MSFIKYLSFLSCRYELIAGSLAALFYSGADLLFPFGTKLFFDQVLGEKKIHWIPWLTGLLVAGILLRAFFCFFKNYFACRASERCALFLKKELMAHVLSLSVRETEKEQTGKFLNLFLNDIECLKRFFSDLLLNCLFSLLYIAALLVFLWRIDPFLTLLTTLFLPVIALVTFYLNRGEKKDIRDLKDYQGIWLSHLKELMQVLKTVSVYHREKHEKKRGFRFGKKVFTFSMLVHRRNSLFVALGEAVSSIGLVLLLSLGTLSVMEGRLTVGQLLAFYLAFAYLFLPVSRIISLQGIYKEAMTSYRRIEQFLKRPKAASSTKIKSQLVLQNWKGDIEFKNVTFGYDPGQPILWNISFKIRAGEKVALVGQSGVGKTTLVSLLCRFYIPWSGCIRIGDQEFTQLDYASYISKVGVVFQEDHLWSGSVQSNIQYGDLKAAQEQVQSAAKKACAEDFICRLPSGYQTPVGENGVFLSGGQRKRISLARVFLKNPTFLILDEAMASLDSESEKKIQEAINHLMKNRTSLVIAHRLSTVCQADRVLVLHNQEIVEEGSPEELIASSSIFAELFKDQLSHFVWRS